MEAAVHVEELDISPGKISTATQRILERAHEDARRRDHPLLTNEHLFLAFAQVEWESFTELMRDVSLNPQTVVRALEGHLKNLPTTPGREVGVASSAKLAFKLALHHA